MAILDNRTLLSDFQATQPDDLSGAAGGTADVEIFVLGSQSYGFYTTSSRAGLLFDAGSAQDWSDNVFYLWVNCGVAGLLDTFANGGMAVRFAGNTVSDWFEVNVAGTDSYPAAVNGGWVMLVVDIEEAKTASDRTNGTPPATTAVRYVGVTTITGGTMPRMVDNSWFNAVWRQSRAQPGITVEATAGGGVPWTWQDIVDAADITDPTKAWGTIKRLDNGTIALNTGVRFGADNTTTHEFSDGGATVGFEDHLVVDDIGDGRPFYRLEVYGNSGGTTNFSLGTKSGTGDDATGAGGGAFVTGGPQFDIELVTIGNVDQAFLYGVSINGMRRLTCNAATAEVISCLISGSEQALIANAGSFLRNTIVSSTSGDGVAFGQTDDFGDLAFCTFEFSDGHGIEITTGGPSSQTSKGNRFIGYGTDGTNDAAVYNNSAASRTISVTDGGSVSEHTVRNGTSASTTVEAAISITFTGFVTGTEIRVYIASSGVEADGTESATAPSFVAGLQAGVDYNIVAIREGSVPLRFESVSFTGSQAFPLNQQLDLNFANQ